MSMKRCFELSNSPSVSLIGRALLLGSVLSLAAACGRRDAAKADSTTADSATASTSAPVTTSSSPVESVSTGETTVTTEAKAPLPPVASNTSTPAAPAHRAVHHYRQREDGSDRNSGRQASCARGHAGTDGFGYRGEDVLRTRSKKTAGAADGTDHLLVSPQEYEGWKMFSVYCYRCHGVDAMGGGIAPNLRHSVSSEGSVTHDVFITTVTNGRLEKGMPSWKALLSTEQMEDLWQYINARSSNRLHPGRPHMAKGANP